MGIKTSFLLNNKFKLYGYIIFLASFALFIVDLFLFRHKISNNYYLYIMAFGLFISAVSREKKETNRTIIARYRSLKMVFTFIVPIMLIIELTEKIFSVKAQINLTYICLLMMVIYNTFYIYYTLRSKKKEEADL